MLPPLCAWILPQGQLCNQPARRGQQLCRAHDKLARIESFRQQNQSISDRIATLDLAELIQCLRDTIAHVVRHRISPERQHLIYRAALRRLGQLQYQSLSPKDRARAERLAAGFLRATPAGAAR